MQLGCNYDSTATVVRMRPMRNDPWTPPDRPSTTPARRSSRLCACPIAPVAVSAGRGPFAPQSGGRAMQVRNIMKSPVATIEPAHPVRTAAQVMRDHNIGSLIVTRSGQPLGILTERDVLHAAAATPNLDGTTVSQHMTAPLVTASTNWDVTVAATEMTHRQIRHLVVV